MSGHTRWRETRAARIGEPGAQEGLQSAAGAFRVAESRERRRARLRKLLRVLRWPL